MLQREVLRRKHARPVHRNTRGCNQRLDGCRPSTRRDKISHRLTRTRVSDNPSLITGQRSAVSLIHLWPGTRYGQRRDVPCVYRSKWFTFLERCSCSEAGWTKHIWFYFLAARLFKIELRGECHAWESLQGKLFERCGRGWSSWS